MPRAGLLRTGRTVQGHGVPRASFTMGPCSSSGMAIPVSCRSTESPRAHAVADELVGQRLSDGLGQARHCLCHGLGRRREGLQQPRTLVVLHSMRFGSRGFASKA